MATQIKTVEELKSLCPIGQQIDCFVVLGACMRSSKNIFINEDGTFSVINEIDWSEDEFTESEIIDPDISIIGKAMLNNAFYA